MSTTTWALPQTPKFIAFVVKPDRFGFRNEEEHSGFRHAHCRYKTNQYIAQVALPQSPIPRLAEKLYQKKKKETNYFRKNQSCKMK